jgi:transcriptional regulator with XRE-family HTH domain
MARVATEERTDPAILRRRLAQRLRELRRSQTQREVATALDWSASKLLRIENATIGISTTDLRALLGYYQVSDPETVDELVALSRGSKRPAASEFSDVFDPEMGVYARYEASASRIRQFQASLIPGLAQTEEYARAVITSYADPGTPADTIERQVAARMARQRILDRSRPPAVHVIIDESALLRHVVFDDVRLMRRQVAHLLELDQSGRATVQVLPLDAGLQRDAQWSFVLLDFPAQADESLVYLEGRVTSVARGDAELSTRYGASFDALAAVAVGGDELAPALFRVLRSR